MKKALGRRKGGTTPRPTSTAIQKAPSVSPPTKAFDEVIDLIRLARQRAFHAVTAELIDLYWRMRQFFDAYRDQPILSTLLRELPWSSNDNEVVEYALSRAMSPTLVAEYRTRLPEKRLLQAKLHEFYQRATAEIGPARPRRGGARRG